MPMRLFKCSKCNHAFEKIVGATTGTKAPKDCPKCDETDSVKQQFSMSGISADVVGGYDYIYGKKSWKRTASASKQAGIIAGDVDPY